MKHYQVAARRFFVIGPKGELHALPGRHAERSFAAVEARAVAKSQTTLEGKEIADCQADSTYPLHEWAPRLPPPSRLPAFLFED